VYPKDMAMVIGLGTRDSNPAPVEHLQIHDESVTRTPGQ